jgi:hypothetical protein
VSEKSDAFASLFLKGFVIISKNHNAGYGMEREQKGRNIGWKYIWKTL